LTIFQRLSKLNTLANKMDNELLPIIKEICHIAATRNEINTRRHRAIRVLEAWNGSNSLLRGLKIQEKTQLSVAKYNKVKPGHELNNKISKVELDLKDIRDRNKLPKKWKEMGLYKLRSLMLQGAGDYALAKHDTMKFSMNTSSRLKHLLNLVNGFVHYNNGSIDTIMYGQTGKVKMITIEQIDQYAVQYRLENAITSMLGD
jgi:hypothetical protein